jgi:hypothetical protein
VFPPETKGTHLVSGGKTTRGYEPSHRHPLSPVTFSPPFSFISRSRSFTSFYSFYELHRTKDGGDLRRRRGVLGGCTGPPAGTAGSGVCGHPLRRAPRVARQWATEWSGDELRGGTAANYGATFRVARRWPPSGRAWWAPMCRAASGRLRRAACGTTQSFGDGNMARPQEQLGRALPHGAHSPHV